MFKHIIKNSRSILTEPQVGVLSAAIVIMVLVVLSQVLGFVSKRVLLGHFDSSEYSLFFAAFRLPELLFEVLALGVFSSAFIPVFAKNLKIHPKEAFQTASNIVNIGLGIFLIVAIVFSTFSYKIYSLIAPGFSIEETLYISNIAKILFLSQGVFIVSYVLTGVLESSRRFLVPAMAPIFYNIGIILGTLFLSERFGLYGPAYGVVLGSTSPFGAITACRQARF